MVSRRCKFEDFDIFRIRHEIVHLPRRVINEIPGSQYELAFILVIHFDPAPGHVHDLEIVVVIMPPGAAAEIVGPSYPCVEFTLCGLAQAKIANLEPVTIPEHRFEMCVLCP